MTIKPENRDAAAASGGSIVSLWNFVLGGNLNIILGVVVALLSVVVLLQRFLINRRELKKSDGQNSSQ